MPKSMATTYSLLTRSSRLTCFGKTTFPGICKVITRRDENEYIPAMLTLTDVSGTHVMDSVGVRQRKLELLAPGCQEVVD